jgi:hypothetical protein
MDDEMGGTCRTKAGDVTCIKLRTEKSEVRDCLVDIFTDRKIILKVESGMPIQNGSKCLWTHLVVGCL